MTESTASTAPVRSFGEAWRDMMPFIVHYFLFGFAWAVYFGFIAIWSLDRGVSPVVIGSFFLIGASLRLVITPVLTEICDKIGDRWVVLVGLYVMSIPITMLMMDTELNLILVSIITCLYVGVLGSTLTILESYTLVCSRKMNFQYSSIRGVMSIAVAIGCLFLGVLFQYYGIAVLPLTETIIIGVLLLTTFTLPRVKSERSVVKISLLKPLEIPYFPILMVLSVLNFMSFSSVMGTGNLFFIETRGFSTVDYSYILSGAILAEGLMLFYVAKHVRHWSFFAACAVAGLSTIVRFSGYYFGEALITMIMSHALHALSYAVYHAMAMEFIRRHVPDKYTSSAQGLYDMSAYFGYGLGTIMAGYMYQNHGADALLFASMIIAGIVWLIASICYVMRNGFSLRNMMNRNK